MSIKLAPEHCASASLDFARTPVISEEGSKFVVATGIFFDFRKIYTNILIGKFWETDKKICKMSQKKKC